MVNNRSSKASSTKSVRSSFIAGASPESPLELRQFAEQAADEALQKSKSKAGNFAEILKSLLDEKFGLDWHCIIGKDFAVNIRFRKQRCIVLTHPKRGLKVIVFKSAPFAPTNIGKSVRDLQDVVVGPEMSTKIIYSSMGPIDMKEALEISRKTAAVAEDDESAATMLKANLTRWNGSQWHVVASKGEDLSCRVVFEDDYYLNVRCGEFRFLMWKHAQEKDEDDRRMSIDYLAWIVRFLYVAAACLFLYYQYHKSVCDTRCRPPLDMGSEHQASEETTSESKSMEGKGTMSDADCTPAMRVAAAACDNQAFYMWVGMVAAICGASVAKTIGRLRNRAANAKQKRS